MKIQVIHCGKIAQSGFIPIVAEYKKRISAFCKAEDVERRLDAQGRDKRSPNKQVEPICKSNAGDYMVLLDERGQQFDSKTFSKKIQTWLDDPRIKNLVFVVGPPYGFDDVSKAEADELWSLATLTIPSDMAYLMVWEQIYRGFTILKGLPYHHD